MSKEMVAGRCIDCKFSALEEEYSPVYPHDVATRFLRCKLTGKKIEVKECPYFY